MKFKTLPGLVPNIIIIDERTRNMLYWDPWNWILYYLRLFLRLCESTWMNTSTWLYSARSFLTLSFSKSSCHDEFNKPMENASCGYFDVTDFLIEKWYCCLISPCLFSVGVTSASIIELLYWNHKLTFSNKSCS